MSKKNGERAKDKTGGWVEERREERRKGERRIYGKNNGGRKGEKAGKAREEGEG